MKDSLNYTTKFQDHAKLIRDVRIIKKQHVIFYREVHQDQVIKQLITKGNSKYNNMYNGYDKENRNCLYKRTKETKKGLNHSRYGTMKWMDIKLDGQEHKMKVLEA